MCGIVGVIQYESEIPRDVRDKALRILFSSAMLHTESRGEDATGVYQVHEDGDWIMTKKGEKVSKWIYADEGGDDPIVYSELMDAWSSHTKELSALVGHCRKATIGSKGRDNDDNHPFSVQLDTENSILGIHNGTLKNHEVIFKKLPEMLERQGSVDSEAIFHMLFHLSEQGKLPFDGDMIRSLGRRLEGAFSCITVNTRFPNLVATFREGRPMEYFLISPLNVVLIVSTRAIGVEALEDYEFYKHVVDQSLPDLQYHDRGLLERDWRIFDTSKKFPSGKPMHGDFDVISTTGTIRSMNEKVMVGWEEPVSTTSKSTTTAQVATSYTKALGKTHTPAVTTAKISKPSAANPGSAAAHNKTKKEDGIGEVVEVEIPITEESKTALAKATSLGATLNFENMRELAETLGKTVKEVSYMNAVVIANAAAQMGFNLGYAVSRFDRTTETEAVLSKGRDQNLKLERAETERKRATEKLMKAQKHVWEARQIISVMYALVGTNYPITFKNLKSVIRSFPSLGTDQEGDLLRTAAEVFRDRGTRKIISRIKGINSRTSASKLEEEAIE